MVPRARPQRAAQIIADVGAQIARYKGPDRVELVESLPKTSPGNIRKVEPREAEWSGHRNRVLG